MNSKRVSSTRDAIVTTALQLFNDDGTAAVSTNHIAGELGISPGNLYYHFRNKEEIIRAIFERRFDEADHLYAFPSDRAPNLEDLHGLVAATFALNWRYRFIFRELAALLRRDMELQRRWITVRARGFDGFRQLLDTFVAVGVLRAPADSAEVTRLAELCWLTSEFWLPSIEIAGQTIDDAQIERGIKLMMHVLSVYILPVKATRARTQRA